MPHLPYSFRSCRACHADSHPLWFDNMLRPPPNACREDLWRTVLPCAMCCTFHNFPSTPAWGPVVAISSAWQCYRRRHHHRYCYFPHHAESAHFRAAMHMSSYWPKRRTGPRESSMAHHPALHSLGFRHFLAYACTRFLCPIRSRSTPLLQAYAKRGMATPVRL